MTKEDIKCFSRFLKEFQKETDRGAALIGAALIDERLEILLKSHLIKSKESTEILNGVNAPLGIFSARIKLSYCLGLITQLELKEIEIIRNIRNVFAHRVHGINFKDQKIHDLCQNLKANTGDTNRFNGNARELFINSVILTSLALWHRPEHTIEFRSKTKEWKYQLST